MPNQLVEVLKIATNIFARNTAVFYAFQQNAFNWRKAEIGYQMIWKEQFDSCYRICGFNYLSFHAVEAVILKIENAALPIFFHKNSCVLIRVKLLIRLKYLNMCHLRIRFRPRDYFLKIKFG